MQKLRTPFVAGDKVSIIDIKGSMEQATVLTCNMQDKKNARWNIVVWIEKTKQIQTVKIRPYIKIISEYGTDLET